MKGGKGKAISFRRDGGRPSGVGVQAQASKHLKRLLLRVAVVSVEEKSRLIRQLCIGKTNVNEPLMTRREF
jgi:hypothetical protein